jgi:AraC-like DNA-binding protein
VNAQINSRKIIRESIVFEQQLDTIDTPHKTDFVEKIHAEVRNHLSNPEFSVEALAQLLFMSKATLSRKTKEELNMSPRLFIIKIRMQHASHLLQIRKLSISEIAYAVGYESLAYFSTSFKKHTGKTPSEY